MKIVIIKNIKCYNQKDAAKYLQMATSTFQYYIYDSSRTVSKIQFIIHRGRRWFPIEYLDKWNEQDSNVLYAYKRKRKSSFTETQRIQHKEIDKMINTAKESLNDKNVFYDLIEKAVYKTLLLKFSLNIDNLNKEKIKSTLRVKRIDEKNISKIIQLIENCENAKYSRSSNSIMNNDLNTAKEIINLIQKNK